MANQSYKELAAKILKLIGGKENISFFTHCVTRLRFNLKDQSLAKEEEIGRLEGVLGTKIQNGQFQVIIGNKVNEVYAAFCEISGLEKQEGIDENLDKVTAEKKKFSLGMLLEVISGCFAPVIPAFAGAGFKGDSDTGDNVWLDVRRIGTLCDAECSLRCSLLFSAFYTCFYECKEI